MTNCGKCGVAPDSYHKNFCGVERCPRCGRQLIGCDCVYEINGIDVATMEELHPEIYSKGATEEMWQKWDREWGNRRLKWTGERPGVVECRKFGFWCMGPPWKSVLAGTPGATEDLNMLPRACKWDPDLQEWVPK